MKPKMLDGFEYRLRLIELEMPNEWDGTPGIMISFSYDDDGGEPKHLVMPLPIACEALAELVIGFRKLLKLAEERGYLEEGEADGCEDHD